MTQWVGRVWKLPKAENLYVSRLFGASQKFFAPDWHNQITLVASSFPKKTAALVVFQSMLHSRSPWCPICVHTQKTLATLRNAMNYTLSLVVSLRAYIRIWLPLIVPGVNEPTARQSTGFTVVIMVQCALSMKWCRFLSVALWIQEKLLRWQADLALFALLATQCRNRYIRENQTQLNAYQDALAQIYLSK